MTEPENCRAWVNSVCQLCNENYYFIDHQTGCFHITEIETNYPDYYLDGETTFKKCYERCSACEDGTEYSCKSCTRDYIYYDKQKKCITIDEKNVDYINFYVEDKKLYKCYERCYTCETLGDENDNKCTSCNYRENLYIFENNCYYEPERPNGYYLDKTSGDKSQYSFKNCHSNCFTCNLGPKISDNECTKCIEGIYKHPENGNCLEWFNNPRGYYFNHINLAFEPCTLDNCSKCTVDDLCTICKTGFTFIEIEEIRYCTNEPKPNNYYIDYTPEENQIIYKKCQFRCETCTIFEKCTSCIDGYFFVDVSSEEGNCYTREEILNRYPNYYEDGKIYKKCQVNCLTCSKGGTSTYNNCDICVDGMALKEADRYKTCFYITVYIPGYIYSSEINLFRLCYDPCYECFEIGNHEAHQCLNCKLPQSYYIEKEEDPLILNCSEDSRDIISYYYDDQQLRYKKCYKSCYRCEKKGDEIENNCKSCKENYYKVENFIEGNCYKEDEVPENYFLDVNIFRLCYENCRRCSYKKIGDDEHCTKCIENYHFYMFETNGNCHNIPPYGKPNYFVNEDDYYQECYYRCLLCNELGDDRNNKCIKCNYEIGYYGVEDEPYKCLNQDEKNSNPKYTYYHIDMTDYIIKKCHYEEGYVLVDVDSKKHYVCILEPRVKIEYPSHAKDSDLIYKRCYKSCYNCSILGNEEEHKCTSCIEGFKFILYEETKILNCIKEHTQPENYILHEDIYRKCYRTCGACSQLGTRRNHYCIYCVKGYKMNKNNCEKSLYELSKIEEAGDFLPTTSNEELLLINVENAVIPLKNDLVYSYYFYDDDNLDNNKKNQDKISGLASYVILDSECENLIRKELNNNDFYVTHLFNGSVIIDMDYEVYDTEGNSLYIKYLCKGKKIFHIYPIIRNNTANSLGNGILSKKTLVFFSFPKGQDKFLYEPNSLFYNDPCVSCSIKFQQESIIVRQEMYKYDITICPTDLCIFKNFSKSLRNVFCHCNIDGDVDVELNFFNQNNYQFNLSSKQNILTPLKCGKFFPEIIGLESLLYPFIQILPLFAVFYTIIMLLHMLRKTFKTMSNKLYNKVIIMPSPPKKREHKNKNENNNFIDNKDNVDIMTEVSKNLVDNIKKDDQISKAGLNENFNNVTIYDRNTQMQEKVFNLKSFKFYVDIFYFKYEHDLSFKRKYKWGFFFDRYREEKLFIFASCSSYNILFPYPLRNIIYLFIFTLFTFINAFLLEENKNQQIKFLNYYIPSKDDYKLKLFFFEPSYLLKSFISFIIGYPILKVFEFVMDSFKYLNALRDSNQLKILIKIIKIKTFYLVGGMFIFFVFFWYYLLFFGLLTINKQLIVILLSIISSIYTIIFQFIFMLIGAKLRYKAIRKKNKFMYFCAKACYYIS